MKVQRKKFPLLLVIVLFLSVVLVALLVYIAVQKGYIHIPWLNTATITTQNNNETPSVNTFTGATVSAILPTGWSMKEYYNGDGTDYLATGPTYTGLTGIKIFNTDNQEMFRIYAVNGIGFEGCYEYYAFSDDNPTYRAQMQSMADEINDTMNINDFSNTSYTQFEWLGTTTRRIDNKLYLDQQEGNNYFEASCFNGLITLEGLYFSDEDGNKYESYFYSFGDGITNEELIQVDGILASMKTI